MPLLVNIRHLEKKPVELQGELPPEELEIEGFDELIHAKQPLLHDITAELMHRDILVQGRLQITLDCECARCLKPFQFEIDLPDWACLLPLEGEDAVPVDNDSVDLTPQIREDILLAFPQLPLCEPECDALPQLARGVKTQTTGASQIGGTSSAWAELDKLKFKKEK